MCASETLYSMDAVAKAPWMGLRRVSEAHKALSLHLTNSCYKVRPEGCGVGLADLPAQDALAEPPWMGLRRVIGTINTYAKKLRPKGCGVRLADLPAQDALAEPPWMGLRRVIGTINTYAKKLRPKGCGVRLADLPAQDALAEPPWMGLRRVREPNTTSLPKTFFAGTKKPANKRALSKLTITQGLVILVKLFFDTCRFT